MSDYSLYYTLNKGVKKTKVPLKEQNEFLAFIKSKNLDPEKKKAVLLLVVEHARYCDGYIFSPKNIILPYGIKEDESGVTMDLSKMPNELVWILYKFSKMGSS